MSLASTLGFLACVVKIASYVWFRVSGDLFMMVVSTYYAIITIMTILLLHNYFNSI